MKICNRNTYIVLFAFAQSILACTSQKPLSANRPVDPLNLTIQWDQTTLRKVAEGGYARLVELTNGKLVTVYNASNGNTEIVTSDDKGDHWSVPVIVAAKANDIRMDAPDITLLNDGSLLVCYNPRPSGRNTDTSKHFGIRVAKVLMKVAPGQMIN